MKPNGCQSPHPRTPEHPGQDAIPVTKQHFHVEVQIFLSAVHRRFIAFRHLPTPLAANDHEPLIAHHGSHDADRCIHRNDHGQPRGRITPATREAAVLAVVVTIAKGYDLSYIWKTQNPTADRTTGGDHLNTPPAGRPPPRPS